MPSEIRHILFADAEVGRAVRFYRERTGTVVGLGEPGGYAFDRAGSAQEIRFSMTVGSGGAGQTLSATGSELAAALILYCRTLRIPLPASAAKSLQRTGGLLCLVVTRNGTHAELPPMPTTA